MLPIPIAKWQSVVFKISVLKLGDFIQDCSGGSRDNVDPAAVTDSEWATCQ